LSQKKAGGRLIVFEGIDGAGKSTQVKLFREYIKGQREALFLREPTDGPWGRKIRSLLEEGKPDLSAEEALHLFTMDRRDNVENHILPALQKKKLVVVDRYYFSSIAYQGALGIDPGRIRSTNESFAPTPDLVFLLQVDPRTGLNRIENSRGGNITLYERTDYLCQVQEIFNAMGDSCIRRLDASLPPELVHEKIVRAFEEMP